MTKMDETERPEETLRKNERRLSRAQAIAHVGDWEWELSTNAVHWSDELYRIYGYKPHEIAPDYGLILQQMHPDSKEEFLQAIDEALKGENPFEMDYTFFRKNGSEAILHTIGEVICDESGTPVRMVGVVLDITEQKRAEELLRESEDKFRSIFEEAMDGIMIADAETRRQLEANKSICRMLGYTREELLDLNIDTLHPNEALPAIRELFKKQLQGEISLAHKIPMRRKDGSVFYADINATSVILNGKQCLIGIFRDITERRQAEEKLKAQGKRLAESQRIAHIGSWEHNLATNQAFWSDELFRLLGLDPEKDSEDFDLFFSMVHPDDQPLLKKAIEETLQLHKPFNIDYRFVLKDGTTRILRAMAELIPDSSGNLVILSGTGQDITERHLAEEKIRESEQFIRNILNTVDEGFIVVDRDYRIISANRAYCEQVSLPSDKVVGEHCYKVSHQSERPCFEVGEKCAVREVFATGISHTVVHNHSDQDGEILFVETKAFPNKDESGTVVSVIETVRNITERHLLEAERLKTQKLEAIGTLAGGIAHDFNNLLQGVFGYVSMAKMSGDKPAEISGLLEKAEQALSMSVNLTNQLLTFAKGGKPVIENTDLRPVIENAANFALSGSRCSCRLDIAQNLWSAEADAGQIGQVIQNIVLNASEAMPEGGSIDISATNVEVPEQSNILLPEGGKFLKIVIQDIGAGIPEKDQPRIFDPYFTTKQKGSGLGLATSYSIIKNHRGTIEVQSKPDSGTAFTIHLPANERGNGENAHVPCESTARKCRILVVDDETVILDVAQKMITVLGHDVALATDGESAVEKYRQAFASENPFDIVILDLTIRDGLGGEETLQILKEIDPNVKTVVSSGYSDSPIISNFQAYGFSAVLSKPYSLSALRACLDALAA
jgi:PAS domain S-box-containing protein